MNNMISLAVNRSYPLPLAGYEGSSAQFLTPSGNVLQICMPNLLSSEKRVYKQSKVRVGMLVEGPVILLLFQFGSGRDIIDCPFDAQIAKKQGRLNLPDIENDKQRLCVDLHLVDTATNLLKVLRGFTLPADFTRDYLSVVQDQLSMSYTEEQFQLALMRLYRLPNEVLVRKVKMYRCGV